MRRPRKDVTMAFRLTEEETNTLREYAKQRGMPTYSAALRSLLRGYCERLERGPQFRSTPGMPTQTYWFGDVSGFRWSISGPLELVEMRRWRLS